MHAADLLRDLLADAPFQRAGAPFRLLAVRGPDAAEFLHRLCSQDVLGLADGGLQPAAFLDAKGKLLVTCLVFRLGDTLWLEVPAEQAERLATLLERYHFTEKLTIAPPPGAPLCWETVTGTGAVHAEQGADRIVVHYARRGVAWQRVHALGPGAVEASPPADRAPLPALTPERAECLRLLAGLVRVGVDTEPTTLALEADLDDHLSTTKGCYTGQEIVARIHTYGHTNRKLCLLRLGPGEAIPAPQPLHEPEERLAVGRVMHAVPVPGRAERLGTGFLPKDFQAIGSRLVLADGGEVEVLR